MQEKYRCMSKCNGMIQSHDNSDKQWLPTLFTKTTKASKSRKQIGISFILFRDMSLLIPMISTSNISNTLQMLYKIHDVTCTVTVLRKNLVWIL